MSKKSWFFAAILVLLAIIIRFFSASQAWVEDGYASGIYPGVSSFLRLLFGWLPFSIGDILYGAAVLWLIWKIVKGIRALFKKRVTRQSFVRGLLKTAAILFVIYIEIGRAHV